MAIFDTALTCGTWVNSAGLVLDIGGAYLLFRFGLPAEISRSGAVHLVAEQANAAEIALGKRYDRWGHTGLGLLIAGFVLQLLSNFIK
jgi:hypothetical protein